MCGHPNWHYLVGDDYHCFSLAPPYCWTFDQIVCSNAFQNPFIGMFIINSSHRCSAVIYIVLWLRHWCSFALGFYSFQTLLHCQIFDKISNWIGCLNVCANPVICKTQSESITPNQRSMYIMIINQLIKSNGWMGSGKTFAQPVLSNIF